MADQDVGCWDDMMQLPCDMASLSRVVYVRENIFGCTIYPVSFIIIG